MKSEFKSKMRMCLWSFVVGALIWIGSFVWLVFGHIESENALLFALLVFTLSSGVVLVSALMCILNIVDAWLFPHVETLKSRQKED